MDASRTGGSPIGVPTVRPSAYYTLVAVLASAGAQRSVPLVVALESEFRIGGKLDNSEERRVLLTSRCAECPRGTITLLRNCECQHRWFEYSSLFTRDALDSVA